MRAAYPRRAGLPWSKRVATIGELSDFNVSDLMMVISQRRRTGRLMIKSGGTEVALYFDQGELVRVGSSDIAFRIGRMLVRQGLLDTPRLLEALQLQAEAGGDVPIGEVLLGQGWITEDDLNRSLEEQTIEVLSRAMSTGPGVFSFDADLSVKRASDLTPMEPVALLRIAVERTEALAVLKEQLPDHLTPLFLNIPVPSLPDLQRALDPPESLVLGILRNGPRTYPELLAMSALDELTLGAAVLAVLRDGYVTTALQAPHRRLIAQAS
jgi:hypothetical protein